MQKFLKISLLIVLFQTNEICYGRQNAVMQPVLSGTSISGKIDVNSQIAASHHVSFFDGLVFALSTDKKEVIGFGYTTGLRTGDRNIQDIGWFRIDGLPLTGNIILIGFKESLKRIHWIDLIQLDEVPELYPGFRRIDIGTVYAKFDTPPSPVLIGSLDKIIALKGPALAIQALFFAGYIAQRVEHFNRMNYRELDQLTNYLYEYYQHNIINIPLRSTDRYSSVYKSSERQYNFFYENGKVLVESSGNRPGETSYGLMYADLMSEDNSTFRVEWEHEEGFSWEAFQLNRDAVGRSVVDVTCSDCDAPIRLIEDVTIMERGRCTETQASELATQYFRHFCSLDSSSYRAYDRVKLNLSGREAFIFASCAGPETRGRFSFVLVERKSQCSVIGDVSLYSPFPEFSLLNEHGISLKSPFYYPIEIKGSYTDIILMFDNKSGVYKVR